jgi:hypothetical protein
MTTDTNQASEDELRTAILANLKHAYFNAKTDTVALANGLIPNQDHALGILENKSDDLMQMVQARIRTEKLKLLAEVKSEWRKFGEGTNMSDGEYAFLDIIDKLEAEL